MNLEEQYPLLYTCKKTGKEYRVKRVTTQDYVVVDPETLEKTFLTQSKLRTRFESNRSVGRERSRKFNMRVVA